MSNLVIYEAKVALLLAVFYICYRILLSRETLHRLNRIVLTGSVIVSFILPFCVLTIHRTEEVTADSPTTLLYDNQVLSEGPEGVAVVEETVQAAPQSDGWLLPALTLIYLIGVVFCIVKIIVELIQVSRIIRSGEMHAQPDGTSLVVVDQDIAPFSWMKWTVLSREDYENGNRHILQHERAHIRLRHAHDLLVLNILSIMQWFNPVMWMLKEDLRTIYEYEADDAVLREGADIKEYQYSLIRKAVSASGYSITNSFNHSILKNRITMMSKTKSVTWRGLKALYVLPLVAAGLVCNAQTVTDYKVSENSETITFPEPTEVSLHVTLAGGQVEYAVNGEKTSLDAIGGKISEAIRDEYFPYVSIIGDPMVKSGIIQAVKDELRKIDFLLIQYVCKPDVTVQRKLEPIEAKPTLADLPKVFENGDVQIRLNADDRLLYLKDNNEQIFAQDIQQKDLFAQAKQDIEKNPAIWFIFVIDDNSSYGAYSSAIQSVYQAFTTVRDNMAKQTFGKSFDELEEASQDELRQKCRVNIIEISK